VAIRVHSDKAGDEGSDKIITVGGYMADSELCEEIEDEWEEATGRRVFHLADFGTRYCLMGSGEWPVPTRNEFLKRLAGIINRDGVTVFSGSLRTEDFYKAIHAVKFPGEVGPMFSACAYWNMAFTEMRLTLLGKFSEKVRYVFEKGDREHEITNIFRDIEKNDDRRFGKRGYGFEPKETTLLQPADFIAGTIQRCVLRGRDAISLLDDIGGHIELRKLSAYYDSGGVTLALVSEYDRDGCRILTSNSIRDLGMVSDYGLRMLPERLVEKRKRVYTYTPQEKTMTSEFDKFDQSMRKLMSVSHDEIKAKLDAEKAAKKRKRKVKKPSASDRASSARD
jgi:hypothetical protein